MVKFVSKSTYFGIQVTELLSEGYEAAQNGIAEHQLPAIPFKRNVKPLLTPEQVIPDLCFELQADYPG